MYTINGLTRNTKKREDQGRMYSKHGDMFKNISAWLRDRSNTTKLIDKADRLANIGAQMPPTTTDTFTNPPINTIPSLAKPATLAQKDFYHGIKMATPPPTTQIDTTKSRQDTSMRIRTLQPIPHLRCHLEVAEEVAEIKRKEVPRILMEKHTKRFQDRRILG